MKKLLMIFSIISLTTLTINITDENLQKQETKTKQRMSLPTSEITSDQKIAQDDNLISVEQHNNLLTAIRKVENKIEIDPEQLEQRLWSTVVYQLLTSKEYLAYLEVMDQLGILKFNANGPFFANDIAYGWHNGFMQETKWYWFGYWKLHIAKWRCDQVYNLLTNGGNASSIFADGLSQTPYGTIIAIASGILSLIGNDWNTDDGMIVHFYLVTPVWFSHR
ncbi:hypothetical protein S100390_v1c07760 [Spiroplasma sp. NBRC 100390]|uniref:hypothetical protein n=1 Tax=unclassified Spiroplasma TaxID=2637901 RepID=UPI00089289F5|nr:MULTISPECIES: hypothetical protein [unclassified Spiroplasma]AOX44112.1 hypothetical protein STU14_v1c07760 [Spiroplasma sp. TU-14]APE13582.1 hypothetical protein S100390_v1c07760 [Spiroplasma sp. NBRC 100390]